MTTRNWTDVMTLIAVTAANIENTALRARTETHHPTKLNYLRAIDRDFEDLKRYIAEAGHSFRPPAPIA